LLQAFFSTPPEGIGRSQQLALALATRSKLLHDYLGEELVRQERDHKQGRLYGLFQIFRDQVFHELTLNEFADAFAQMLAYGLFLARLNSDSEPVTLHNAREHVPGSFRLIRELVDFLTELEKTEYRDVRWVVEEVLSIVNALNLPAIREDLSFRNRKAISRKVRAGDEEEHRLFERDPFIYFYEDYLKAYDAATRKARGVYYTPPPIVNFIVRAVDDILKTSFGIHDGLADSRRITVLDFACGTGTFLLEVFQRIFNNIGGPRSGRADLIVREHMLKNMYGFEYLIAPYTIAHLKLSQFLGDQGHPLKNDERLQVFLTNTLEPIHPQPNLLLPAITAEAEAAQTVKDKPILVITGNPPYSGHSKNKGAWIAAAIDGYKFTVEMDETGQEIKIPLGERNPKWLNDDYVKFIRFAQLKMDAVNEGIVGIITNHSWLDNPTFRGMRQSLMRSFEQIYVLDLHGNAKKREQAPDGSKDENVFDIEQGVAISLFVKRPGLDRGIWRGDLWGKQLSKYQIVSEATLKDLNLAPIVPAEPQYLYHLQDAVVRAEYEKGHSIAEIMPLNSVGIVTSRDRLAIAFTESEMEKRAADFARRDTEDARLYYKLGKDVRDWRVEWAQEDEDWRPCYPHLLSSV
jgi:predicted helicase